MSPLQGLTVVALEQAVAAPFATRQLAEQGARVIKIERPETGDFARRYDATVKGLSSHFVWLNRGKESLTLDFKDPEGRAVLTELLERADIFIQNLAPGALDRVGLSTSRLRSDYPRLIICSISGYGPDGSNTFRKAYDLLIQGEAGLLAITGTPESPCKVGISIADIAAGMYAYAGVLTSLILRGQTSHGTVLDVNLFDALTEWMGYAIYYILYGGSAPKRTGASHATICPYGPFACGDQTKLLIAVQNEREWLRFCDTVLKRPELAADVRFRSNSDRVLNRKTLSEVIGRVFGALTSDALLERLDRAEIAYARMNDLEALCEHSELVARDRWREIDSPVGPLRAIIPPVSIGGLDPVMGAIPELGQHTDSILRELGFTPHEIAGWHKKGMI